MTDMNKPTNQYKQTNKQTNKHTNKQTNRQTNNPTYVNVRMCVCIKMCT